VRRILPFALVVWGLAWAPPVSTQTQTSSRIGTVTLQPCPGAGVSEARCGTVSVFEDRAAKAGRKISLHLVVVPHQGKTAAPDPVFWFEGGPGGAATQAVGPVSQLYLRDLLADHDLVFVDQRGTGASNPLQCRSIGEDPADVAAYYGKLFPPALIRACRQQLESIADLRQYTTSVAMDDLDDVRRALGYERINLAGASYGTTAALVYMRQHPEHVRSAFLVGVATPGFKLPLPFARAAQHAWDQLLTDCAADQSCRTAFPRLREEFDAVLATFDRGPVRIRVADPSSGQIQTVTLERENYVEHIRLLLYSTRAASFVPLVVHRAFQGDFAPFVEMAARFNMGAGLARGMYFSVTCTEDVPFIAEADIVAETRGTFLGDRRVRAHAAACREWTHGTAPTGFGDNVRSEAPVILFSGEADGATPPWIATNALATLPNGRQLLAPHTGHQMDSPCIWGAMQALIRTASAKSVNASCVSQLIRPPFATDIPRAALLIPEFHARIEKR
jgi:pimeloyl-ACP methyl ester carboxylesterase